MINNVGFNRFNNKSPLEAVFLLILLLNKIVAVKNIAKSKNKTVKRMKILWLTVSIPLDS